MHMITDDGHDFGSTSDPYIVHLQEELARQAHRRPPRKSHGPGNGDDDDDDDFDEDDFDDDDNDDDYYDDYDEDYYDR